LRIALEFSWTEGIVTLEVPPVGDLVGRDILVVVRKDTVSVSVPLIDARGRRRDDSEWSQPSAGDTANWCE
jgi:hypothetical protein